MTSETRNDVAQTLDMSKLLVLCQDDPIVLEGAFDDWRRYVSVLLANCELAGSDHGWRTSMTFVAHAAAGVHAYQTLALARAALAVTSDARHGSLKRVRREARRATEAWEGLIQDVKTRTVRAAVA